jgi:hypothetical protein
VSASHLDIWTALKAARRPRQKTAKGCPQLGPCYTARGKLDRSFGSGGVVITSFGTGEDWAGALARQSDGKLVVGGEIYRDQAVARYLGR